MRKKKNLFGSADELDGLIAQYFDGIAENPVKKQIDVSITEKKKPDTLSPATITGLAFHLGFSSRQEFERYEHQGKFADQLKRARLRIMADYEKKLHVTSSTGAIFALKSMGWNEQADQSPFTESADNLLKVEIIQSGPPLALSENEVTL